ncbi:MAG: hypothetical protein IT514_14045 [Burkholderiales bacterium]|nr:hypothetical protein [Burkholderiales bacterium]
MKITAGSRWKSAVCATEIVIVKAPKEDARLECGGVAMLAVSAERAGAGAPSPERRDGTLLGKRYGDQTAGLEVLCIKAGEGSLSLDGRPLALREARPLPSSD